MLGNSENKMRMVILDGNPEHLKLFVAQLLEMKIAHFQNTCLVTECPCQNDEGFFLPWSPQQIQKNKNNMCRPRY